MTYLVRENQQNRAGLSKLDNSAPFSSPANKAAGDIQDLQAFRPKDPKDPNSDYEEIPKEEGGAYGFQRSVWLAKAEPKSENLSIKNADNYKYFTMAMV